MKELFTAIAVGLAAFAPSARNGTASTSTFFQQLAIACAATSTQLNTLQVCGVFTGGAQTTLTSQIKPDVAEVVELAGTSGGSIVATLFASGMPLDILRELCMTLDQSRMMSFSPWARVQKQAYNSGNAVVQFLEKLTDEKTFADLAADLKVIASDLLTEREYVFSRAPDRVRSGRVRERSLR